MKMKPPAAVAATLFIGLMLLPGCGATKEYRFAGQTMGTTYHIKVVRNRPVDLAAVQAKVEAGLEKVNQSMSTFRPGSELSRFNALTQVDTPFAVSASFLAVMQTAQRIYRLSQGAWDGTVDPLVNLWGFGKKGALQKVPSPAEVEAARQRVGFDHVQIDPAGFLIKKHFALSVDLASIAKGYGVDQVAEVLSGLGFKDFLVEIGGEVYAAGQRPDGTPWRVGINRPEADVPLDAVYQVVRLKDRAMATSGDYRNFYKMDGKTYSHIIDPRTGYPIQNRVVSASVIAANCTLADGLATALMVMGPEKGIALLDQLDGVEGLIIVRQADGSLQDHFSKGMKVLLADRLLR
jgi:thiamine biosynthesis lipoprotein